MDIFLIEDNLAIVSALEFAFRNNGYHFHSATTIHDAKNFLTTRKIDLIVLDISLPDGNGMRFYESEILKKKIPTLFLTAVDDEDIIVKGLNLGADDYIAKPFSTKELMARVNRVLVRNSREAAVCVKDLIFDMDKMTVTRNGVPVSLTSLELKLLHLFFLNLGKVVSRNTILDKIWEWTGNDVDDHTVTVYLKRIREKVGNDIITTVKGIGYRIDQHEK